MALDDPGLMRVQPRNHHQKNNESTFDHPRALKLPGFPHITLWRSHQSL
jgi:hypothetical protein